MEVKPRIINKYDTYIVYSTCFEKRFVGCLFPPTIEKKLNKRLTTQEQKYFSETNNLNVDVLDRW